MNPLDNLSIQHRSLLNLGVTLIGIVILVTFLFNEFEKLGKLNHTLVHLSDLESDVQSLRNKAISFQSEKQLKYAEQFTQEYQDISNKTKDLTQVFVAQHLPTSVIEEFSDNIQQYSILFTQVVSHQTNIGLDPKSGHYGALRQAVHNVESEVKALNEYELLSQMLQLRRAEKDFMLRLDTKYLTKFNENIQIFEQKLDTSDIPIKVKQKISRLMQDYSMNFEKFVQAQDKLGLDLSSGLIGDMFTLSDETIAALSKLKHETQLEISNKQNDIFVFAISIAGILIVIIFALGIFLSRHIVNPINNLYKSIDKIRKTNDLTIRIDVKGQNEISYLAHSFNELQSEFAQAIHFIHHATELLESASVDLNGMTTRTQNATKTQQDEADLAATATNELQSTVAEISRNTELAASNAASTAQLAGEGKNQVEHTVKSIQNLASRVGSANAEILQLDEDSKTIGNIIEVIQNIAEQTNLLALNAAIESARAGEQGRGFAVVADEVRNLAMRTQESTKQIEQNIAGLQSRCGSIVTTLQACLTDSEQSVTEVKSASRMLQDISSEINQISDMNTTIASAVEEQNVVTEEVSRNVTNIRDLAVEIHGMAATNQNISSKLNTSLDELVTSVAKFKIN
ncbi:methyl-accepting chemotaxis protein [Catenovulum agarivorans]|uniref:methyl-accepting chemotaxis protein n=1 Tax=Catenovulum agarivorans TaxID=1172192 RepID=UPI000316F212|nr:methyl-accepting chemotaxis protein [Catenovulum agarivorans]